MYDRRPLLPAPSASSSRRALQCLAAGALLALALRVGLLGAAVVALALWGHDPGRLVEGVAGCAGAVLAAFLAAFLWRREPRGWRDGILLAIPLLAATALLLTRVRVRPSPETFHGVVPNPRGATWTEGNPRRPRVTYRTNALGFRGPTFATRPAPGVTRVAVVGDSHVFGSGVEEGEALPARLALALTAADPARRFEVLNLGIEGNNLHSHLRMLEVARRDLGARVAVLALTLPNDLTPWDTQDTLREGTRFGAMTVAYAFFGERVGYFVCESWMLGGRLGAPDPRLLAEGVRAADRLVARGAFDVIVLPFSSGDRRLTEVLQTARAARVVLPPEGREAYYFPMDGHLTPEGHRAFAEALAPAVLASR